MSGSEREGSPHGALTPVVYRDVEPPHVPEGSRAAYGPRPGWVKKVME